MRLRIVAAVLSVVCAATPLVAQLTPASPKSSAAVASSRSTQARSAIPAAPALPQAVVDATALGSPLVLDKDWRVGITADPAAATPGFRRF